MRTNKMSLLRCLMIGLFLSLAFASVATSFGATGATFYSWAKTPPMGWNSWDCYGAAVNEAQTRANADYMAAHLKVHGWEYIVVDIQWYEPRAGGWGYRPDAELAMDQWGRLLPATNRFPSAVDGKGFTTLAGYCHGLGLKFGVHLLRGIPRQAVAKDTPILGTAYRATAIADKTQPCPWNGDMWGVDMSKPGAQEYFDSVFKLLAAWGVDFIKIDDLSAPYHKAEIEGYRTAIDRCGRSMVFSTSPGDTPVEEGAHVATNANMWRIRGDFWDDWPALKAQFDRLYRWTPYRGEGHYPDADMLPLGAVRQPNGWTQFSKDEQITHMTLWSIAKSPLIFGGHLPKNDAWTLSLLTNDEVIAVNQLSTDNKQLFREGDAIAWTAKKPGATGKYLALFNAADIKFLSPDKATYTSSVVSRSTPGHSVDIDVDIKGARKLFLVVDDAGDTYACDHADWIEPRLVGPSGEKKLTEIAWQSASAGWGRAAVNRSVSGGELIVNGQKQAYGIGTHSKSVIEYKLPEGYTRFKCRAGLDQGGVSQQGGATVKFLVYAEDPITGGGDGVKIPVKLSDLGFAGECTVRDLWQQKDQGTFTAVFAPQIRPHSAGLYLISPR
ncbi:MAG: NPCBM/NEW2 domain-containing protein [Verrucomicrobia bacterium]|nr:NPCBM/NEW2 domain-containing protein [Verrucomicrobiota bacterium]